MKDQEAARSLGPGTELSVLAVLLLGGLLAGVAGWLPWDGALPLALAAGIAGFLPRRSLVEAGVLALPLLLAQVIEWGIGPFVLAALVLPIYALTMRPRFAVFVGTGVLALLLLAIYFKTRFAGTRLTWQDAKFFFLQFRDNVGVMASQPTLLLYAAAALLALAGWICIGWFLDRRLQATPGMSRGICAGLLSLGLVAGSVAHLSAAVKHLRSEPAWNLGIAVNARAEPLLPFFATIGLEPGWMAPPADVRALRAAVAGTTGAGAASIRPADIVVFLQESQFNPRALAGCSASLCGVPEFERAAAADAQGPLRVHVFGGGTWLTEFAFATGVPHEVFGPAGDFAPFNVAPGVHASFIRSLRRAGFRTVALYPVPGGMMNARAAYAGYGFDRFLDSDDLGLPGSFGTPDDALHLAAERVLKEERKSGKPVFLMVVTIFNHGEHGVRMDRVPPALRDAAASEFSDPAESRSVSDYVWRTREFARAMERTRRNLLASAQPTVVAWFGDHQPPFANALGLRSRQQHLEREPARIPARFQTWYSISSNRSLGPLRAPDDPLDIVFLPGLIAQAGGVPQDAWLAANVLTREACRGLLAECATPGAGSAYLAYLKNDQHAFLLND